MTNTFMLLLASLECSLAAFAAPPVSSLARDREAILAMAGAYTVTFDFQETVAIEPGYQLHAPYHATGEVELVEVLADEPRRIELQHLLIVGGSVVKHWRQEWLHENRDLHEFAGDDTWRYRQLDESEARGTWTQRVSQVDDSPRYESYGRWTHDAGVDSWESGLTWRPLPRREFSKRSDYDVLAGRNRHTLTHTGWVHEQDNYKLVLRDGKERVLARETGINRYDHVDPAKADAARGYWARTAGAWATVRAAWRDLLVPGATVHLRPKLGDEPTWKVLSDLVENAAPEDPGALASRVRATLEEAARSER